ncbi:MAG: protein kinase [Streptomyces sp.]|nr:protein kinase [Streptomyces sp.]
MVEMIGRYRVLRRLGRGGMGTVWLAEDSGGQRVAVKVINAELAREPEFRQRFRQEVEAARRVRRFCTAPVVDAGLDQDPLWVATDFIDGPTVHEAVSVRGPLRGADLDALAVNIATALTAIHEARLIHRDLKPSNVLLSPVGPRVIDFGIARALDATGHMTRPGTIIGTPGYIAPELLAGQQPLPAADVFSWGAVLAYAGTGRLAFPGAGAAEINARVQHAQPDLDGLEPHLRRLVARALAKDPAARPSVPQLLSELTGSPLSPRWGEGSDTRRLTPPSDSHRAWRLAGIGAAVLVAAGTVAAGVAVALAMTTSSASSGPIVNPATGLCIDSDGPQRPGVDLRVDDCGNYTGQSWSYNRTTGHLTNPPSGLCLDTAAAPAWGVHTVLNPCGNYTGQQWQYDADTGRFTNPTTGLCLGTARPPAVGVALALDLCGNYADEKWHRL